MAVAALTAIGLAAALLKPTDVNALTGCPRSQSAPDVHTIILIDATDRLPGNELRFVQDLVMTEYMWLPIHGRLTVRTLQSDPAEGEDIVICRVAEGSRTGGLLDNERMIRGRFDKIAGARMAELISSLTDAPEQDSSPIMEAIQMILDRSDFLSNVERRRLVVVSDFAQHSESHSMYGAHGPAAFSDDDALKADLDGVDMRLQYVRRRGMNLQGPRHREVWVDHLRGLHPASLEMGHSLLLGEPGDRATYRYEVARDDAK